MTTSINQKKTCSYNAFKHQDCTRSCYLLLLLLTVLSWSGENTTALAKRTTAVTNCPNFAFVLSTTTKSSQPMTNKRIHPFHRHTFSFAKSSCLTATTFGDDDDDDDATTTTTMTTYTEPRLVANSVIPSVALVVPVGVRNTTARGSGFVIDFPSFDNDGTHTTEEEEGIVHLLTAAHVAAPGYRIKVVFSPSSSSSSSSLETNNDDSNGDVSSLSLSVPASVIGRDNKADLALLRVNVSEAIASSFAPPPSLKLSKERLADVGTKCFSIGYPSGGVVGAAMTSGIVCANALGLSSSSPMNNPFNAGAFEKNRNDADSDDEEEKSKKNGADKTRYVVTDAAMAGGMSGGPLVDTRGTVLGVNALINMELRALGNYAVGASECLEFLSTLRERLEITKREESASNQSATNPNAITTTAATVTNQRIVYRVMLYNDRFNKRARVESILKDVAQLNTTEANRIMMDAHTKGRGVVCMFSPIDVDDDDDDDSDDKESSSLQDDARRLCEALRNEDLLVEVEEEFIVSSS